VSVHPMFIVLLNYGERAVCVIQRVAIVVNRKLCLLCVMIIDEWAQRFDRCCHWKWPIQKRAATSTWSIGSFLL